MKVYINQEFVPVQLEGETTLAELYESMRKEMEKNHHYILDFEFKTEKKIDKNEKMENILLEDLKEVFFQVGSVEEMLMFTLLDLDRYTDKIGGWLFETIEFTEKDLHILKEGILWIIEVCRKIINIIKFPEDEILVKMPDGNREELKENIRILENIFKREDSISVSDLNEKKEIILHSLRVVKSFSFSYSRKLFSDFLTFEELEKMLENFYKEIDKFKNDLETINTWLQTGQEKEAMELIEEIAIRLEFYSLALITMLKKVKIPENIDNVNFKEFLENITEILEKLSTALEEVDFVTVGDILEYELSEQLDIFKHFYPYLKKILTDQKVLKS